MASPKDVQDGLHVPGTVKQLDITAAQLILVPRPSNDVNDPLNWTRRRKLVATVCLHSYVVAVGIASAAIYSVLTPISDETVMTLDQLNAGTGYMFLFFGLGCLVWQPVACKWGKRPVYLLSLLGTLATCVWVPYTRSNGAWIASKILQGFMGAPIESLAEMTVSDIYFTHERGGHIGLYALMLCGASFIAPLIAGFISDGQGWQWVQYWCAIFCAIAFFICFFFMEETNFNRHSVVSSAEKSAYLNNYKEDVEKTLNANGDSDSRSSSSRNESDINLIGTPKKFWQKLKLFDPEQFAPTSIVDMAIRPLVVLVNFPVVAWAGFFYGSTLVQFNILNATTSLILGGTPYDFAPSMVGLSYVGPILGTIVGSMLTGPIADRYCLWVASRNNGVREPEHRLRLAWIMVVVCPCSLILWGVGASESIHWVGLVFGMGLLACTLAMGASIACSYAIDSYKAISAEAMVVVILVRNCMSFAIGYGITPWITNEGLRNCFIEAAFISLALFSTMIPFLRYGKILRRRSAARYYKFVEEGKRAGIHLDL
ncbi:hypothetical protein GYMLUDRAFT_209250 [Collybiopsis luxurians FD-317 M1]|uniref:Major facilitator superfamily (MFS) profile domain-containing protein n=1 Tax=Collybiopsis luxurians FD-317 M1 TaxID=944289 RepID=A0A0D0C6C0_9AGAR|nr:hypothetical protein GYMLUDRAFT_209250 [Collybiopsis luxurians FD-317 M1]